MGWHLWVKGLDAQALRAKLAAPAELVATARDFTNQLHHSRASAYVGLGSSGTNFGRRR